MKESKKNNGDCSLRPSSFIQDIRSNFLLKKPWTGKLDSYLSPSPNTSVSPSI